MSKNTLKKILIFIQKYLHIDILYWFRGGFWLSLAQGVTGISSFLLSLAFANWFSPETYGTYRYILSTAGILAIPTLHGMHTSLVQSVARGYDHSIFSALKTRIRYGLLGGIISLGISGYYFFSGDVNLSLSFLIAAIFLPLMDSFNLYEALLIGKKEFQKASTTSVIAQIVSFCSILLVLYFTRNLILTVASYFVSLTIIRYILFHTTVKHLPLSSKSDHQMISYGKHLSLMGIIGTIATYFDRLLIFHFLGATEVAMYTIAIAPPEQIKALLKSLNTLLLPKFSKETLQQTKQNLKKNVFLFGSIVTTIIVIYIFCAPIFFQIFFSQYTNGVLMSQIFSLSLLATILFIPVTLLQSQKKNRALYSFNIVTSTIQIILVSFGIFFFGLMGVVFARVISRLFSTLYAFYLVKKV